MIYLDNSATSYPKPEGVKSAIYKATKYYYSNPGRGGYSNSLITAQKIFEVREKTAAFFSCEDVQNVVFCLNCTMAINTVIKGILHEGDHVVISDLEHNSVLRPLETLKRQNKIKYDVFETDFYSHDITLLHLRQKVQANTKLVICTHASNVLGIALPIERIGKFCKENHILFCVDAAQTAGILPIDMHLFGINFLCVAAHKGLFAPMGTGILLTDGTPLNSLIEGGTGSASMRAAQPDFMPDRLESGTPNVSGIMGIGAGINYINDISLSNIHSCEKKLILDVYEQLRQFENIKFYCDYKKCPCFSNALSFNIDGFPSEEVARILNDNGIATRAGLHCAPLAHRKIGTTGAGTVRISPSVFTTQSEINYTIDTIKKIVYRFKK